MPVSSVNSSMSGSISSSSRPEYTVSRSEPPSELHADSPIRATTTHATRATAGTRNRVLMGQPSGCARRTGKVHLTKLEPATRDESRRIPGSGRRAPHRRPRARPGHRERAPGPTRAATAPGDHREGRPPPAGRGRSTRSGAPTPIPDAVEPDPHLLGSQHDVDRSRRGRLEQTERRRSACRRSRRRTCPAGNRHHRRRSPRRDRPVARRARRARRPGSAARPASPPPGPRGSTPPPGRG